MENENTQGETLASKHIEIKGVDPRNIIIVPDFNVRQDFGNLEELMYSIIENGIQVPLKAKKVPNEDKWELIDGERRLRATLMAIEKGHDIKYVPVMPFKGSSEERLIAMAITGMDQKKFSKLEQAEIVRRLVNAQYSVQDIAKRLSKSAPTIYELLELSRAPQAVKEEVKKGTITPRTVVQVMKQNPDDDQAVINTVKNSVEKAQTGSSEGGKSKKVTVSDVPGLKTENTDEKIQKLITYLAENEITGDRVEFLRTLAMNLKTLSVEKLALLF